MHCDKILNHLANDEKYDSSSKYDLPNYYMKSTKFLNKKLKRGLSMPFVLNENEEYLFLISNSPTKHFAFSKHVKALIGLTHFELEHMKNAQLPLSLFKRK